MVCLQLPPWFLSSYRHGSCLHTAMVRVFTTAMVRVFTNQHFKFFKNIRPSPGWGINPVGNGKTFTVQFVIVCISAPGGAVLKLFLTKFTFRKFTFYRHGSCLHEPHFEFFYRHGSCLHEPHFEFSKISDLHQAGGSIRLVMSKLSQYNLSLSTYVSRCTAMVRVFTNHILSFQRYQAFARPGDQSGW
jgi:hypothetical protein